MNYRNTEKKSIDRRYAGSAYAGSESRRQNERPNARPTTFRRPAAGAALLFGLSLLLISAAAAGATSNSPAEIMQRVDEQRGPDTSRARMIMRIFRDAGSSDYDREVRMLSYGRGTDESHIEFVTPRNIRGLRVLDLDGAIRVFFPSTGRVRNISGTARSGSVGGVGGDFTYEDMGGSGFATDYGGFTMEDDTGDVWIISGVPKDDDSQYSRLVFHIEQDRYVPVRIDYFENGTQVKRLDAGRIQNIAGRYVATDLTMHNLAENSRTAIRMQDVEWDVSLDADLFDPNRFHR